MKKAIKFSKALLLGVVVSLLANLFLRLFINDEYVLGCLVGTISFPIISAYLE